MRSLGDRFKPGEALKRFADLIDDGSVLRRLSAFRRLEADTRDAVSQIGLPLHPVDG